MTVLARDRIAAGRQPDFDIDAGDGHQAVLFVADVLDAMRDQSCVEVKRDRLAAQTGNVYLEYACRISGQWVGSGIAHTTAELWSIAIGPQVVITTSVEAIRAVARRWYHKDRGAHRGECKVGGNPTKGILIPVAALVSELLTLETR